MAIVFSGTKLPQTELAEIQREIYADWGTFRDGDVTINEGHKSSADVYESKVEVNMTAYSSGAVAAGSDTLTVEKTPVSLIKVQFADTIDYNTLLDTRFERSMAAGAFNTVSTEFDNAVLQDISPAISKKMEYATWNGATSAQQTAIAALTPGAAQGSISAGAQTLAAAMPTNLVNSLPATILYNDSISKVTAGAGLGDYKKVLAISTVTAANIAAQYALIYQTLDPDVIANEEIILYAPLAHMQFIKSANNAVGAAQQVNFLVEGEKMSYNGIEIKIKPLVGFVIASPAKYLHILMDLASDVSQLKTGENSNGAETYYYKNVQAYATWCTNQRYITMYGG
jgi:hypothetical protein